MINPMWALSDGGYGDSPTTTPPNSARTRQPQPRTGTLSTGGSQHASPTTPTGGQMFPAEPPTGREGAGSTSGSSSPMLVAPSSRRQRGSQQTPPLGVAAPPSLTPASMSLPMSAMAMAGGGGGVPLDGGNVDTPTATARGNLPESPYAAISTPLWHQHLRQQRVTIAQHNQSVRCFALSPDNCGVVFGGNIAVAMTLQCLPLDSGTSHWSYSLMKGGDLGGKENRKIEEIKWCPTNTNRIASAHSHGNVLLHDRAVLFRERDGAVYVGQIGKPDGHMITPLTSTGGPLDIPGWLRVAGQRLAWHPRQEHLAVANGSRLVVLDCTEGRFNIAHDIQGVHTEMGSIREIAFSPFESNIGACCTERGTFLFDLRKSSSNTCVGSVGTSASVYGARNSGSCCFLPLLGRHAVQANSLDFHPLYRNVLLTAHRMKKAGYFLVADWLSLETGPATAGACVATGSTGRFPSPPPSQATSIDENIVELECIAPPAKVRWRPCDTITSSGDDGVFASIGFDMDSDINIWDVGSQFSPINAIQQPFYMPPSSSGMGTAGFAGQMGGGGGIGAAGTTSSLGNRVKDFQWLSGAEILSSSENVGLITNVWESNCIDRYRQERQEGFTTGAWRHQRLTPSASIDCSTFNELFMVRDKRQALATDTGEDGPRKKSSPVTGLTSTFSTARKGGPSTDGETVHLKDPVLSAMLGEPDDSSTISGSAFPRTNLSPQPNSGDNSTETSVRQRVSSGLTHTKSKVPPPATSSSDSTLKGRFKNFFRGKEKEREKGAPGPSHSPGSGGSAGQGQVQSQGQGQFPAMVVSAGYRSAFHSPQHLMTNLGSSAQQPHPFAGGAAGYRGGPQQDSFCSSPQQEKSVSRLGCHIAAPTATLEVLAPAREDLEQSSDASSSCFSLSEECSDEEVESQEKGSAAAPGQTFLAQLLAKKKKKDGAGRKPNSAKEIFCLLAREMEMGYTEPQGPLLTAAGSTGKNQRNVGVKRGTGSVRSDANTGSQQQPTSAEVRRSASSGPQGRVAGPARHALRPRHAHPPVPRKASLLSGGGEGVIYRQFDRPSDTSATTTSTHSRNRRTQSASSCGSSSAGGPGATVIAVPPEMNLPEISSAPWPLDEVHLYFAAGLERNASLVKEFGSSASHAEYKEALLIWLVSTLLGISRRASGVWETAWTRSRCPRSATTTGSGLSLMGTSMSSSNLSAHERQKLLLYRRLVLLDYDETFSIVDSIVTALDFISATCGDTQFCTMLFVLSHKWLRTLDALRVEVEEELKKANFFYSTSQQQQELSEKNHAQQAEPTPQKKSQQNVLNVVQEEGDTAAAAGHEPPEKKGTVCIPIRPSRQKGEEEAEDISLSFNQGQSVDYVVSSLDRVSEDSQVIVVPVSAQRIGNSSSDATGSREKEGNEEGTTGELGPRQDSCTGATVASSTLRLSTQASPQRKADNGSTSSPGLTPAALAVLESQHLANATQTEGRPPGASSRSNRTGTNSASRRKTRSGKAQRRTAGRQEDSDGDDEHESLPSIGEGEGEHHQQYDRERRKSQSTRQSAPPDRELMGEPAGSSSPGSGSPSSPLPSFNRILSTAARIPPSYLELFCKEENGIEERALEWIADYGEKLASAEEHAALQELRLITPPFRHLPSGLGLDSRDDVLKQILFSRQAKPFNIHCSQCDESLTPLIRPPKSSLAVPKGPKVRRGMKDPLPPGSPSTPSAQAPSPPPSRRSTPAASGGSLGVGAAASEETGSGGMTTEQSADMESQQPHLSTAVPRGGGGGGSPGGHDEYVQELLLPFDRLCCSGFQPPTTINPFRCQTMRKGLACGAINLRCIICEAPVAAGEQFLWLRDCGHGGHTQHILSWLQLEQAEVTTIECPACGIPIEVTPIHNY